MIFDIEMSNFEVFMIQIFVKQLILRENSFLLWEDGGDAFFVMKTVLLRFCPPRVVQS